ncbi:hemerythrin domain-containing protein [Ectobacillus ponti]|uniref:Hemerythrin domain-containing protein n=1 Tax=Ectobacillus ponti TaxID=2961894 RepID=A0AA41X5A7_9BACI|nr:hemerythrin domain-containing protein [Ectobacillus ponti]MCP8969186.1 hemerythrin domain-containing protein [Ectobacillus ponti]
MNGQNCAYSQLASSHNGTLCRALSQFKQEHQPLHAQKLELFQLADSIQRTADMTAARGKLLELEQLVLRFMDALEPHSEREEALLFPMMAAYIGRETGPIAVMEYEHEQAKGKIASFLSGIRQLPDPLTPEETAALSLLVMDAYSILTDHFFKEEQVLFPMAEQILSAAEKEQLAQALM